MDKTSKNSFDFKEVNAKLTIGNVELCINNAGQDSYVLLTKDEEYPIHNGPLLLHNISSYRNRTTIADVECPTHYSMEFPLIDFIYINRLSFIQGNFIKYLIRVGKKDDFIKDIDKCISYLQMMRKSLEFHKLALPAKVFASINHIEGFKKEALILFDKLFLNIPELVSVRQEYILLKILKLLKEQRIKHQE